ncbi:MAG: hypothetical protein BGO55_09455 [Sphingobacteriales bacterium 50-39]|nr:hypothetical protein [Sphingobacteriales bacterium]OJW57770.1 MAG: hypothetical protein BGO55_09455 [Sphingobacteriales bacterium 50-39]
MSLNDIQLKDLVVSELYRDNLLASDTPPPASTLVTVSTPVAASAPVTAPAAPSPTGYKFLGNNRRKISIIVNAPDTPFLPDDQLSVLTRMLEACRMNIGDVAIVNHAAAPVAINTLKHQLQPGFVLLFGPTPRDIGLPMDFPVFKIQPYDQCTYLTAPSLEDMVRPGDESKLLKSKLWVCLKTLFEI